MVKKMISRLRDTAIPEYPQYRNTRRSLLIRQVYVNITGVDLLALAPDIEKEGQESKISRTLQQPSTSCLSFSSQFLSTEQEERRRPQTGQEDRKTG